MSEMVTMAGGLKVICALNLTSSVLPASATYVNTTTQVREHCQHMYACHKSKHDFVVHVINLNMILLVNMTPKEEQPKETIPLLLRSQ